MSLLKNKIRNPEIIKIIITYAVAILLTSAIWKSNQAESFELILYDYVNQIRKSPSGRNYPLTIISITESDINQLGWPIDDSYLCKAIDKISQAGAKAIGFDLYRNRGVGKNQECLQKRAKNNPLLVSIFNESKDIEAIPGTPNDRRAYNDLILDPDGVIRRDLVHVGGQGASKISLPLRLVSISNKNSNIDELIESGEINAPWLSPGSGGYQNIDAGGYQKLLFFREPNSFKKFNLTELLKNNVPIQYLTNKIVLIGSTAPSLKDFFEVPYTRFTSGKSQYLMPGVEVHAHRVANLIDLSQGRTDKLIKTSNNWVDTTLLTLVIIIAILIGETLRDLNKASLIGIAFISLFIGTGFSLIFFKVWVSIILPVIAFIIFTGSGLLRRGVINQQQRQLIQKLLGQTTSPKVAEQLWNQREQLLTMGRFQGRQINVTILIGDICDFTKLAENMPPEDLLNWLNKGMSKFVPSITNKGGIVNKFTGDGFLAVFGAPLSQGIQNDASSAIEAAISLQQDIKKLNDYLELEGQQKMRLRIGIHSGSVLAGSIGSKERLEYGVIGDTVNCASRLESLKKTNQSNDCRILISNFTKELINSSIQVNWISWGLIKLQGRQEPIEVWELHNS